MYLGSKPNGIVKVIEAMDPFRSGGPAGAVRRKFNGIATQGGLTLALRPIKQNPQIAGIVISGYSYGKSYMEDLPTVLAGPSEGEDFSSLNNMGPSLPQEANLIYDPSLNPKLRSSSVPSTPSGSSTKTFTMNTNNNLPSTGSSVGQLGTSAGFGGSSGTSDTFAAAQYPPNSQTNAVRTPGFSSSYSAANPYGAVRRASLTSLPSQTGIVRSDGGVAPVGGASFGTFRRRRLASYLGEEAPLAFPLMGNARESNSQQPFGESTPNSAMSDQNGDLGSNNEVRSYQSTDQPTAHPQQPPTSSFLQGNLAHAPHTPADRSSSTGTDSVPPAPFASSSSLEEASNLASRGQHQLLPQREGIVQQHMPPTQIAESSQSRQQDGLPPTGMDSIQQGISTIGFDNRRVSDSQIGADVTAKGEEPTSNAYHQARPNLATRIGDLKPTSFKLDSEGIRGPSSSYNEENLVSRKRSTTEIMNGIRAQLDSLIQQAKAIAKNDNESLGDDSPIPERQWAREGQKKLDFKSVAGNSADQGSSKGSQVIQNYPRERPSTVSDRYEGGALQIAPGSRAEASSGFSQPHPQSDMYGRDAPDVEHQSNDMENRREHHRFSSFRHSTNDNELGETGKNVRRFSDFPELPPGIVQGSESVPEAPESAGVHIGSENLDGICINNSTHCSCGMVMDSNPEECLYVVKEDVSPMLCVRKPCNGKLVCACAPGASSLCVRSTVMEILVPATAHKHGETEESEIVPCRREKLEHGIGFVTPAV